MTIQEIKTTLTIQTVLNRYGLRPNKNNMLPCPFHSDKKASMKIYPKTNTVYCFAGSCKINNLDTIDFIK
ncbi:MAG TPA: DNA primase, partial [Phaeodactylibacter sp.]|nr:DNA primase [Phaeodactylibacter sp.]